MAYTPFQDGTQAFGIPDSPLTINSITYIAEDINPTFPQTVVQIKDQNGIPTGQVLIPQTITFTAKLQLATLTTAIPVRNTVFTFEGGNFIIETVGIAYTQGNYTYVNITAREKIN